MEKHLSIKTVKLKKINVIKNEDVYDIKVNKNHNFFANGILVHNCGEQPLPNSTSCNLGSINVAEFITEDNKFDEYDFGSQVVRSMYYLDLVIDATKYPLTEIEKRTKAIRPVGLGIMGLADLAIKLNIEYGSPAFLLLCKKIGQIMSAFSLISTIEIAKIKGSYDEYWEITDKLFGELNEIKDVDNERFYFNSITNNDNVPYTFKHAMYALALYTAIPISEWTKDLVRYGLRNSRRLSIAPTGTISLILNTSSSIEPNFAYEWTRTVTVNKDEKQELKYYHKLYNENNKNKGLLVSASDLSVMQHVETVAEFAKWIDSGISKTVNLAFESTVDDVKQIYEYCYNNKIKGITIYRDGSRNNQPLVKTKSKIENEKDTENNIIYELNVNNDSNSGIRIRPKIMRGLTTKSDSPYGSIYVTANFDDNNKMFETFISAGKSGSVSKSVTEALSRVISLALRSNVDINDIVKTISNISGSEIWVYDTINGKEVFVKSIPDVTAKMLADINDYSTNLTNNTIDIKTNNDIDINMDTEKMYNKLCPECGSTMIMLSGCQTCMNCGYSPCK